MDLGQFLANADNPKIFLTPNTSDQELVENAKNRLAENGLKREMIEVNYDMQLLNPGDLFVSYDPPDLVVRAVYEKRASGMVKMKSVAMIKL